MVGGSSPSGPTISVFGRCFSIIFSSICLTGIAVRRKWDIFAGHIGLAALETGIDDALGLGGFGVVLRHLGIRPAKDRHQLMFGRAGLGEDRRGRLSEAMRRAFRQISIIAPLSHLVAEAVPAERLAIFGDKEGRLIVRNSVQRLAKLVRDRQAKRLRIFAGTLLRHEFDTVADQVPPAEFDEVGASDAQIQHQVHCKPGHGAQRIGCTIARQLRFAPGVEAGRLMNFGDAVRGIERRQFGADSPIEERLQILYQFVSRARRAAALHLTSFNVGFANLLEGQLAHIAAIAIENALLVFLRGRRLALKRLGPIIGLDKPANGAGLQS
nr:hypothetical protein [Agrobacterium sp. a22-2]